MKRPCLASRDGHKGWMTALAVIALSVATLPPALAAGNAASGRQLYQTRCVGCHGDGGNSAATLGPNLAGIVGRKAGTGESGVHSRALTESNIKWDEASLRWFLAGPTKQVEGTTMPTSVLDPQQIEDLVAYLKTLR
jgi:cytochrome c